MSKRGLSDDLVNNITSTASQAAKNAGTLSKYIFQAVLSKIRGAIGNTITVAQGTVNVLNNAAQQIANTSNTMIASTRNN
jgi:hypothetical protein